MGVQNAALGAFCRVMEEGMEEYTEDADGKNYSDFLAFSLIFYGENATSQSAPLRPCRGL